MSNIYVIFKKLDIFFFYFPRETTRSRHAGSMTWPLCIQNCVALDHVNKGFQCTCGGAYVHTATPTQYLKLGIRSHSHTHTAPVAGHMFTQPHPHNVCGWAYIHTATPTQYLWLAYVHTTTSTQYLWLGICLHSQTLTISVAGHMFTQPHSKDICRWAYVHTTTSTQYQCLAIR